MAKIFIKFNAAVIKEIELTKNETTFGRKPNNDIVIDNPAISGFHGKIVKDGDAYVDLPAQSFDVFHRDLDFMIELVNQHLPR